MTLAGKSRSYRESLRTDLLIYERTKLDNRPELFMKDQKFIKIMDAEMQKNAKK